MHCGCNVNHVKNVLEKRRLGGGRWGRGRSHRGADLIVHTEWIMETMIQWYFNGRIEYERTQIEKAGEEK